MPQDIINAALYADRTVQDWHRHSFPTNNWAIDLDLMGACNRCRLPLYLIESTTNPNKPHTILDHLSRMSGVPALVVIHNCEHVTRAYALRTHSVLEGEDVVRAYLSELRAKHDRDDCSRALPMRLVR